MGVALVSPKTRHQGHSFSLLHKKTQLLNCFFYLVSITRDETLLHFPAPQSPCEDKNLSTPDQIADFPSLRTKSKQKQTPFQNNLRNLLLIFSVYSSISGNIVESSPLCILVGISCLQKDSPKAIRGLKHLQSFQNHIFSLNVTRCWAARYVLCFTSHNLFTFLHPIVAYRAADNCIPEKKAQ